MDVVQDNIYTTLQFRPGARGASRNMRVKKSLSDGSLCAPTVRRASGGGLMEHVWGFLLESRRRVSYHTYLYMKLKHLLGKSYIPLLYTRSSSVLYLLVYIEAMRENLYVLWVCSFVTERMRMYCHRAILTASQLGVIERCQQEAK